MRRSVAAIAMILGLPSLASPQSVSDLELAQIAALRHELSLFNPGKHKPPHAFCVGVKAHVGDPSPEFLMGLAGAHESFVPLSQCGVRCPEQEKSALHDQRTPLYACGYISAGDVWLEPEGQANLSVRFMAGPRWGRYGVYQLRKENGQWKVFGYELGTVN